MACLYKVMYVYMLQTKLIPFILLAFVENDMNKIYIYWRNFKSQVYDFGNSYMGITCELSCRSRVPAVNFVLCITLSLLSDASLHASSWSRTDYYLAHACIRSGKQTDIPCVAAVFVSWCTLNYMTLLQQFYITKIWFCF